jgi:hypothetical protein
VRDKPRRQNYVSICFDDVRNLNQGGDLSFIQSSFPGKEIGLTKEVVKATAHDWLNACIATRVRTFEVAIDVRLFEPVLGLLIEKLALFLRPIACSDS